jgi:hypothetical protein
MCHFAKWTNFSEPVSKMEPFGKIVSRYRPIARQETFRFL